MRTEARLTHTGPEGDVSTGLAGSWAAGAVLVTEDAPARFDRVTTGRTAIFTDGRAVSLPDHRDGWRWAPYAVDGADIEAARQQLQRLMRDAESDIAEQTLHGRLADGARRPAARHTPSPRPPRRRLRQDASPSYACPRSLDRGAAAGGTGAFGALRHG